jgi:hypothetical protein
MDLGVDLLTPIYGALPRFRIRHPQLGLMDLYHPKLEIADTGGQILAELLDALLVTADLRMARAATALVPVVSTATCCIIAARSRRRRPAARRRRPTTRPSAARAAVRTRGASPA